MAMTERLPLTRERILAAAVELVDASGVESLSMRKLGAALGVEAMSLYNHVSNKDDVINGILDVVVRDLELPDATLPWDEQLRIIAHRFRAAGHAHPRIFPLFGSRPISSIEGFQPLEQSYLALRGAGLDPDDALDALLSLSSFVFGFVLTELGGLVDVADVGDAPAFEVSAAELANHPGLVDMAGAMIRRDGDRQFAFGVELNLRGLTEMIAIAKG